MWWARDLRLHHARSRAANAANWAGETRLGLDNGSRRNTSSGGTTDAGACKRGGTDGLRAGLFRRRWTLDGHGDDLLAAEKDKAERAAVLTVATVSGLLALGRRKLAELLTVAEDKVHVSVECHEFSDELASILNGDAHSVVDVLEHLGTLRHRHFQRTKIFLAASSVRVF